MQGSERHRVLSRPWYILFLVFTVVGILLAIHQLFLLSRFTGFTIMEPSYLYILLGIFLSLVFIIFPATKGALQKPVPWYDVALFLTTLGVCAFFAYQGPDLHSKAWEFVAPTYAMVLGFILWLLALEGTRRAGGLALFIIVFIFHTNSFSQT